MGFRITTNINAIDTQRNLLATSANMATTMRRLSSGLRINSAADDAAGLAISQKLGAQANGLSQAVRNAQDGISLVQTADGALNETQSILQRMRTLAVQSSNDTNTQTDRTALQSEMNQLATELSRISNTTTFNTKNLLAGGFKSQAFQIGADANESLSFSLGAMDAASLGVAANSASVSAHGNTSNIGNIVAVGSAFADQTAYAINTQRIAAGQVTDAYGTGATTPGGAVATTAVVNTGNEVLALQGTFAGAATTNYVARVVGVQNGVVTRVAFSTDNGQTFATATGKIQGDGSEVFLVQQSSLGGTSGTGGDSGLKLQFSAPANTVSAQVGDQFTFQATPGVSFSGVSSTTFTPGTGLTATAGTYVNGSGGTPVGPSATVQGTYSGPYAGAISIATNMLNVAGGTNIWDPGTALTVKIGNTTLDPGQFAVNTTNSTLSLFGLTFTINGGTGGSTGGSGTSGTMTFTTTSNVALSGGGQGATVTVGNTTGVFTTTATASVAASGPGAPGLGFGSLLLEVTQYGGNATDPWGINNIAWQPNGASGPATYLTNDFSYNGGAGMDVYSSGASYGGSLNVTGADGSIYKVAVSNATSSGATVALQNSAGTTTYATYQVSTTNANGATPNDVIALNIGSTAAATVTKNIGAETATVSGSYTGTLNQSYTAQVTQVDASGNATQIQLSTDGGQTYQPQVYTAANIPPTGLPPQCPTSFDLANGLTLSLTPGATGQMHAAVGDAFQFIAIASAANGGAGANLMQLNYTDTHGGTYNIGSRQLLQATQTSATLGAADLTLTAQFTAANSLGGVTAGGATLTSQRSQGAFFGMNSSMQAATAYAGLDITTQADAQAAISALDTAITTVSTARAQLGAIQNRLDHAINSLSTSAENLNAAQSRIQDVDVASETITMTKNQILEQAGISVLSQANQQPQMVLKLLQ